MDYSQRWQFAADAFNGLDSTALVQFNREHDDKFTSRKELSYYVNYIKPKAKQFISYFSQKNISRTLNNKLLDLMLNDVDRRGNAIDVFIQNFAISTKVRGVNICLVDMPKTNSKTQQEQLDTREVPYFVEILPETIDSYKIDEFGKFEWIVLKDTVDNTEAFGDKDVTTIYRYYDKTSWKILDEKKKVIEHDDHILGVCPVIAFSESGTFPNVGDYIQIADISKRIMNLRSELDEILRSQTFSILTYKVESANDVKDLEIGTNNLLLYKYERPEFISAPDAPAKVYQAEIDRLENLIEKIATTEAISSSGNESGITKQYRFQALNSSLIDFSMRLEDFERECFNIACKWLQIENKTEISYPRDYNIKDVKTEIETASALFEMNLGDTYTALKKEQLAFLDLNGLEDNQKEVIKKEIEANLHDRNQPE